jgi:DNA polymerase epsilon subunit 2
MKVSLEVLSRVYDNMRNQGDRSFEDSKETLDPDSHLHFVDAFDMPLWNWSGERGTFEK